MLSSVSHRDLAISPTGGGVNERKPRGSFKFTAAQKREMEKVRKTTWGKERATAIATLSKEWSIPLGSISYRIYRGGAPKKIDVVRRKERATKREKAQRPQQKRKYAKRAPATQVSQSSPALKIKDTKLRFKITGLEIDNGEIVMTLRT